MYTGGSVVQECIQVGVQFRSVYRWEYSSGVYIAGVQFRVKVGVQVGMQFRSLNQNYKEVNLGAFKI